MMNANIQPLQRKLAHIENLCKTYLFAIEKPDMATCKNLFVAMSQLLEEGIYESMFGEGKCEKQ